MKKVFDVLKKYFIISIILSSIIIIWGIVSMIKNNTVPNIDLFYIIKAVIIILGIIVLLVPAIALMDLFCVQSLKLLYKDYKESDKKGRIILIVICICILLRKILIWTS